MSKTPLDLYKQKVKDKVLHADPHQEAAVQSLDRLHGELLAAHQSKSRTFLQKLLGFAARKIEMPHGVYMYGGVGRGKSMLMDLLYDCVPGEIRKRRVHFHAFMIEVHDYIHSRRMDDGLYDDVDDVLPSLAERIAERSQLLCFDEFHVTDVADAMILGRLFTTLFDRGVVVVATSNWDPDRLYEGGLQRDRFLPFIELLKKKLEVVELDGPKDYRAECLETEGTYFYPLGRSTLLQVEKVFYALTNKAAAKPQEISVKGRTIKVKEAAKGVARFTFSELCEEPLGAEDYLTIANVFETVFLEGVPKLPEGKRNEAKRLMTLVDALYESKTKLVITADVPPDQIYTGKDHGFEFQRTVSRLLEMQSEKYLEGKK